MFLRGLIRKKNHRCTDNSINTFKHFLLRIILKYSIATIIVLNVRNNFLSIEKTNLLAGQNLGNFFAIYIFLTQNEIDNTYYTISQRLKLFMLHKTFLNQVNSTNVG